MILAAALLVLVALGLFVGGVVTGVTTLYWACVGVSAGAAVLLVLARRQLSRPGTAEQRTAATTKEAATSTEQPATTTTATTTTATTTTDKAPAAPAAAAPAAAAPAAAAPAPAESEPSPAEEAADAAPSQPVAQAADGGADGEPPVEEVEVTDLLLVVDLHDEVLVIDEHPRYHRAGCRRLAGRETIPLPVDEARRDGFTPCGDCTPDRHLADAERARRASGRAP